MNIEETENAVLASLGVKSLINLQEPGEHKNCGCPLEPSGFTYEPTTFMDYGSKFVNYTH